MNNKKKIIDTIEYRNIWVRNLVGKNLFPEERAALASAGSVIPTMTAEAVWDKLVSPADLLGKVDVTRFASYVKYPIVTVNNAATAQAVGAELSPSADEIDSATLIPREYAKNIFITTDITNTEIDAIHDWIVNGLAAKISEAINADILVGNGVDALAGTNELTGIAKSVNASDTPLPEEMTLAALLGVMKSLPQVYQKGAIWIMTPDMFYENVLAISNLNNYIASDGFDYRLIGHDVVLMPEAAIDSTENIFYGDPKAYKVNFFDEITVKAYEHATNLGSTWKGFAHVDGTLLDANAFVRFTQAEDSEETEPDGDDVPDGDGE